GATMTSMRHFALGAASALVVILGAGAPLAAQTATPNAHWQAWIGCWQAGDPNGAYLSPAAAPGQPVVCVVPGKSANAVDVVTVDSTKILSRYSVDASGARHDVDRE